MDNNDITKTIPAQKAKRGRPLGHKVGPRPTCWVAAAIKNNKIIMDKFQAPEGSSDDQKLNFSKEDAVTAFELKYSIPNDQITVFDTAFHEKKGGNKIVSSNKEKKTLTVDVSKIRKGAKVAIFDDWEGFAHELNGETDVSYFIFMRDLSPVDGKNRTPPKPTGVKNKFLEFKDSVSDEVEG